MQTVVLDESFFADDMAKGAKTEEKMQNGVDQVSDSCDSYDKRQKDCPWKLRTHYR